MLDHVLCADGHSYERASIQEWLENHDTSPLTGMPLEHKLLVPNHALRKVSEEWRSANQSPLVDLLGSSGPSAPVLAAFSGPKKVTMWLQPQAQTGGLKVGGGFMRAGGKMYMDVRAQNCGQGQLTGMQSVLTIIVSS